MESRHSEARAQTGTVLNGKYDIVWHSEENLDSNEIGMLAAFDATAKGKLGKKASVVPGMGSEAGRFNILKPHAEKCQVLSEVEEDRVHVDDFQATIPDHIRRGMTGLPLNGEM